MHTHKSIYDRELKGFLPNPEVLKDSDISSHLDRFWERCQANNISSTSFIALSNINYGYHQVFLLIRILYNGSCLKTVQSS